MCYRIFCLSLSSKIQNAVDLHAIGKTTSVSLKVSFYADCDIHFVYMQILKKKLTTFPKVQFSRTCPTNGL